MKTNKHRKIKKMKHATLTTCAASTLAACNSVLLVGKRGAGKSTMLDYVVQCAAPLLDAIYVFGATLPPSIPELFGSADSKKWEWKKTLHPAELQAIIDQRVEILHESELDADPLVKLPRVGVVFDDCDSGFRNLDSVRFLLSKGKDYNIFVAISAQVADVVPRDVRNCLQVVIAFPESSTLYRKSLRKILRVFNTDEALLRAFIELGEHEAVVFDAKAYEDGNPHLFRCSGQKVARTYSDVSAHETVAVALLPRVAVKVEFGIDTYWSDVTEKYATVKTIVVPRTNEARVIFFGTDPRPGVQKQVIVTDNFGKVVRIEAGQSLVMGKSLGKFSVKTAVAVRLDKEIKMIRLFYESMTAPLAFLRYLYATLTLKRANFDDVYGNIYPEQEMLVRYIPEDSHVLELAGGIGRNSCIIAALLRSSANLVVLESDKFVAKDKVRNGFDFAIEHKTLCSLPEKHDELQQVNWPQLRDKYPWLSFNTLLGGTLYCILQNEPELLFGFKRVLLQNNYNDDSHKIFVAGKLVEAGMACVYSKQLECHIAAERRHLITPACVSSFYEVWSV